MLIVQIALGIILAVLILVFLPQILSISIWLAIAGIVMAVIFGVFALASSSISEYIPDIEGVMAVVFVLLLTMGLIIIIYQFVSKLIVQIKSKIANSHHSNNFNLISMIPLIFSVFWDNFNTTGKAALIGISLLVLYGLLGGGFY
jgi:hypothetical protein